MNSITNYIQSVTSATASNANTNPARKEDDQGNTTVTALHAPYKKYRRGREETLQSERRVFYKDKPWYCQSSRLKLLDFLCEDEEDPATRQGSLVHDNGNPSPDSVYEYYWNHLLPAIISSLPLLLGQIGMDLLSFVRWTFSELWRIPKDTLPSFMKGIYDEINNQTAPLITYYSPQHLAETVLKHFDANNDGRISASEILSEKENIPVAKFIEIIEQAFESQRQLASSLASTRWIWLQQMWPMLDWKIGVFLWRTCGGLLLIILFASIVPGRLHAFCGRVLRWPILFFTYFMISMELVMYVLLRLFIKGLEMAFASPKHRSLRRKMERASDYGEWFQVAKELDASQRRDIWQNKSSDESTCRYYNWAFIRELMGDLRLARDRSDSLLALAVLQQCTRKNVGGVMSEDLFSYTNTGETKVVVEEFIQEVVKTIYWLTEVALEIPSRKGMSSHWYDKRDDDSRSSERSEDLTNYQKSLQATVKSEQDKLHETLISWATLNFFNKKSNEHKSDPKLNQSSCPNSGPDTVKFLPGAHRETVKVFLKRARAAYGRTALVLSGGAMMGCYHFGTVKALLEEGCLPHIISGTSAGSVVGAVVCTRDDEELKRDLDPKILEQKLTCFSRSWPDRMKSLWKDGHLFDTNEWLTLITWFTNGDLTFEEAYRKTGRVLCITLSATTKKAPPVLLNYITAPNVVIASAIVASAAVPGFIPPVLLQVKGIDGVVRNQDANKDQTYWDGSIEQDIPINGLAETFNVQFFLVAQANPHIVPFFFNNKGSVGKPNRWSSGVREDSWRGGFLLSALELYLKNDMKSKFVFLRDLEAAVGFTGTLMTQSYEGTTTIVPQVKLRDYFQLFSNPSFPYLKRCFQGGAVGAYQKIAMMKVHYLIAHALDECLAMLEEKETVKKIRARQARLLQKRKRDNYISGHTSSADNKNDSLSPKIDDEYEVGGFDGMECAFTNRSSVNKSK